MGKPREAFHFRCEFALAAQIANQHVCPPLARKRAHVWPVRASPTTNIFLPRNSMLDSPRSSEL